MSIIVNRETKKDVTLSEGKILEAQKLTALVQVYLSEAEGIQNIYQRNSSEFQYERYVDALTEASFCSERLSEKLRKLVLWSGSGKCGEQYKSTLIQTHGICVSYDMDILKVNLPFLLPHRKKAYTDYLYLPLYLAFQQWSLERILAGKPIPVYEKGTICFVHIYDREMAPMKMRDHDNIEEKQVVDAMGTFFLTSDNGLHLNTYHTSELDEIDRTEVFLMSNDRFSEWILSKNDEKTV